MRRTGIEMEFGGLDEQAAVRAAQQLLGGKIEQISEHETQLVDSKLGKLKVYLDTSLRKGETVAERLGLTIGRNLIPVEVTTEPLEPRLLPLADELRAVLRDAGAIGSRGGAGRAFGVHLNVSIAGTAVADILPVLRAFALLEDWLRHADPIDMTRRLMPFMRPYPRAFVDEIARDGHGWNFDSMWDTYLRYNATRNRGLDMLPILATLDPQRIEPIRDRLGKLSARPAFHFRLPDSRIDEADWTLAYEFNRWALVERLAEDDALLAQLSRDWLDYRASYTSFRDDWRAHLERFLKSHFEAEL